MKNNKGMSTIVATLIIILLVLVAIGLVWVVVRPFITETTEQFDVGTKCNLVALQPTQLSAVSASEYKVTLERSAGGDDITGVKLIFSNATGETNYVHSEPGNIAPLATTTISVTGVTIPTNVNKVEVAAYFETETGEEVVCTGTTYLEI